MEIPALTSRWQQELAQAIRNPAELLQRLELPLTLLDEIRKSVEAFPLLVPESFLNRMRTGDRNDPLLRQVLPDAAEVNSSQGFTIDPVGDEAARLASGLLQKYSGRVLMITLGQCAVHCRYCFRRHYPYHEEPRTRTQWQAALETLSERSDVEEIILSGGDPLVLGDHRLDELLTDLEAICHLQRVRVHTRLPIVLPSRVTNHLIDRFANSRLQSVFVVHSNHPQEIEGDCAQALHALVRGGIPVLNQAVLLKGINDTADIQAELCRRLINLGVIPYYLHQLDRVQGAAHFETEPWLGPQLISELKSRLPGYAVPRFVQEIAGAPSKTERYE